MGESPAGGAGRRTRQVRVSADHLRSRARRISPHLVSGSGRRRLVRHRQSFRVPARGVLSVARVEYVETRWRGFVRLVSFRSDSLAVSRFRARRRSRGRRARFGGCERHLHRGSPEGRLRRHAGVSAVGRGSRPDGGRA